MGTPDYPRIAQNLALVQSLRAAQPAKIAAATPPTQAPAPGPVAELPPEPDVVHAPVVVSEPVTSTQIAPPPAPEPAVASTKPAIMSPAPPVVPRDTNPPGKLASLNADPTVVLAPARKDAEAPVPIRPAPVKAEPAVPAQTAEKKFVQPAPKLAPEAKTASASPPPASSPVPASSNATYFVQAGAFSSQERAGVAASALDRLGARVTPGVNDGRAIYRVRIGPFLTIQQAKAAVTQAQEMGHADLRIVTQ
jgi:septal ring-binding cell division protein DamX